MEISTQEWKALARIRQSEDGKVLMDILARYREQARDALEQAQAPHFSQHQGRASLAKDLADNLDVSPDVARRQ